MTQTAVTQTEQIFYPGWLMACQLRNGHPIPDGQALYRRARQRVTDMRSQLSDAGFSESASEQMLFALCALLDESVLNRGQDDDAYRTWQKDPLQAHFFSRLDAGEALWEQIRGLLKSPTPDVSVMTCLYRTLQLGFVGQYREQDDERREDVVRALAERVPSFALTQDSPVVVRSSALRGGRWWYWLSWGTGGVALVVLWFVFSALLDGQVAQIIGAG